MRQLGTLGLAWRPEVAWLIQKNPRIEFVEVIAETLLPKKLPRALLNLRDEGRAVAVHSVSLSIGSPLPLPTEKLDHLVALAEELDAPVLSDHVAFAKSPTHSAPHFLPVPRTDEQLDVLVENLLTLRKWANLPIAVENAAALFEWPESHLTPPAFLRALLDRSGCLLILDVANLHADCRNHGSDPMEVVDVLCPKDVAYVHVAGGREEDGVYVDTHAHPIEPEVFRILTAACQRLGSQLPLLLEWDAHFPNRDELEEQLSRLMECRERGPTLLPLGHKSTAPQAAELRRPAGGLLARQAEILAALFDDKGEPDGFWPAGFQAARRVLRRKSKERT